MKTCKIFISYAHEDEDHWVTLGKHLKPFVRDGIIEIWHDRKIAGGQEWVGVIAEELASADIVLLLISPDFLNSEYCINVELATAIHLHYLKQTRLVPVILRSCQWEQSDLSHFSALPSDGAPAVESPYPDIYFNQIAEGILKIVEELQGKSGQKTNILKEATVQVLDETTKEPQLQHTIDIRKFNVLGIEIDLPFSFPWPPTRSQLITTGLSLLAFIIVAIVSTSFAVYSPLKKAQIAMRMARYDEAVENLKKIPSWLSFWPTVQSIRNIAKLGKGFYVEKPDWEILGRDLRLLRKQLPNDAILLVLDATYCISREDNYDKSRQLAEQATEIDGQNAEAWFLLGIDSDLKRDILKAEYYYHNATKAAPDSPQYRSNLAHTFLDQGSMDKAISIYSNISQFPLARLEQALAHWAKGEFEKAANLQQVALDMLADAKLMMYYYNRRDWFFFLSEKEGLWLAKLEDKRCYAELEKAVSGLLGKEVITGFPPTSCNQPPLFLKKLVASNLCHFVDGPQPQLIKTAKQLRQALGQPANCPDPKHTLP